MDAQAPRLDPVAHPHLGVGRAAGRERQHEPGLRLAQDHAVVHDVAALVEQQRVARAAGLDVRDVARVEPLEGLDDVRPGHDELAERADVADRDALADGPVLGDGVAVVPRPPPAAEAVHPRARARGARRGAACAGRRRRVTSAAASASVIWRDGGRAVNGGGDLAGPRGDPGPDVRQAGAALAGADARRGVARLSSSSSVKPLVPGALEVVDGRRPCSGRRRRRSVGAGGSGCSSAAEPDRRATGTVGPPSGRARRAARGPGRGSTVSHGVVVSTPVAGSAVTTAATRPSPSPSNRTSAPVDALGRARRPAARPTATAARQVDARRVQRAPPRAR